MGSSEADVIRQDERSQVEGVVALPTLQKMTLCMVRTLHVVSSEICPKDSSWVLGGRAKKLERGIVNFKSNQIQKGSVENVNKT